MTGGGQPEKRSAGPRCATVVANERAVVSTSSALSPTTATRASGRAHQLHVEAAGRAGPAVADAGRAGEQEDRHDSRAVASVVDVRGDPVRQRAVARAGQRGLSRFFRERRGRGAARLEPALDLGRLGAPDAGGQVAATEAALVVAGHLPGHERRQPAGPEAEEEEGAREERQRTQGPSPRRRGSRLTGDDVDGHSLHGVARRHSPTPAGRPRVLSKLLVLC